MFEVGSHIWTLGERPFTDCSALESICIPSSIEAIPYGCFRQCTKLSRMAFDSGCRIAVLGKWALSDCSVLKLTDIPSPIEAISNCGFFDCKSLSNLNFKPGSRIAILGEYAFVACLVFESIRIMRIAFRHQLKHSGRAVSAVAQTCQVHVYHDRAGLQGSENWGMDIERRYLGREERDASASLRYMSFYDGRASRHRFRGLVCVRFALSNR
jgi:hypothetical protein